MNAVKAAIARKRGLTLPDSPDSLGDDVADEDLDNEEDKAPYESLAREGAPEPDIKPMAPATTDSGLGDFDKQQQGLNQIRDQKREQDLRSNVGMALSHATLGTKAPTSSDDLYKAIDAQQSAPSSASRSSAKETKSALTDAVPLPT